MLAGAVALLIGGRKNNRDTTAVISKRDFLRPRHLVFRAALYVSSCHPSSPFELKENAMKLVERVRELLLSPRTEWAVIDAEPTTPAALYTGYVMPLAAIGPVAQVIGYSVFGLSVPFLGTYRVPIGSAITSALVTYILSLIGTYLLGLMIDGLGPTFGAQRNPIQALKVAAYSSTPAWLAGVFALVPGMGVLQLLGLYSVYLLYLGLPIVMKVPRDKTPSYTVVVILAAIVLFMLTGFVAGRFLAVPTAGMTLP
jgi:hypothetical protein